MSITIHNTYTDNASEGHAVEPLFFPGGEPHCTVPSYSGQYIWIDARIGDCREFMRLLCVLDAVRRTRPARMGLFIPYFPGARQDRAENRSPLTAAVYADCINRYECDTVLTCDPHSDVTAAIVNNHMSIEAGRLLDDYLRNADSSWDYAAFVCPDAGAEKRVSAAARACGMKDIVYARKKRDPMTGKLSGFACDPLPKAGRYLFVDDVCDGGGTFIGLRDSMRDDPHAAQSSFHLFTSLGIFSKGLYPLLGSFQRIITTDGFPSPVLDTEETRLDVIRLFPFALDHMQRTIAK